VRPRDYPGCPRSIALLKLVALDELFREGGVFRDRECLGEVARGLMPRNDVLELGLLFLADRELGDGTTGVETAPLRRIYGAGHVSRRMMRSRSRCLSGSGTGTAESSDWVYG